jgi:pyruvate formate-lyase activating enzyme-like uncharacterized protein
MDKCYVVPISLACNADCTFCASKSYGLNKVREVMPLNSEFDSVLVRLMELGINRFEITGGGEPTLNPQLDHIIKYIRASSKSLFLKMYTNGQRIVEIEPIQELNISRVHWNDEINERYMKFRQPIVALRNIAVAYRNMGVHSIRLSVPLIKGAIDSSAKMLELVERTSGYIDRYVFRPLYLDTPPGQLDTVDVHVEHPLIEIDRAACGHNRPNIIWAPDHKLYSSWRMGAADTFN